MVYIKEDMTGNYKVYIRTMHITRFCCLFNRRFHLHYYSIPNNIIASDSYINSLLLDFIHLQWKFIRHPNELLISRKELT